MGVVRDKLDYLSGTKRLLREAINAILADRGDPLLTESTPFEDYPSALWALSPAPSAGSLTGSTADKLLRINETKARLREAINVELGIGLTESDPFRQFAAKTHPVLSLYQNNEQGAWYDPSDLTTLYQDSAGTTPVTADGDPVGLMMDKSGNGNHASQSNSLSRPIYRTDGVMHWLEADGVDDYFDSVGLVPYDGTQWFISTAMAVTGGWAYPGPWRFLRDGGSPAAATDNLLEEYTDPPFTRKALAQRYPSAVFWYDATSARPAGGENQVSWQTQGSVARQQVIPRQTTISELGAKSLTSGNATLSLFRGYSGRFMAGRIYGFIWLSRTPSDGERDNTNQFLMDRSGVVV
jgi:hypothetical protein